MNLLYVLLILASVVGEIASKRICLEVGDLTREEIRELEIEIEKMVKEMFAKWMREKEHKQQFLIVIQDNPITTKKLKTTKYSRYAYDSSILKKTILTSEESSENSYDKYHRSGVSMMRTKLQKSYSSSQGRNSKISVNVKVGKKISSGSSAYRRTALQRTAVRRSSSSFARSSSSSSNYGFKVKLNSGIAGFETTKIKVRNVRVPKPKVIKRTGLIKLKHKVIVSDRASRSSGPSGPCPRGWKRWKNYCFFWRSGKIRWRDAKTKCEHLNSHLASINSKSEHEFIQSLLPGRIAFGLYKRTENSEWENLDGEPVTYLPWHSRRKQGIREADEPDGCCGEYPYCALFDGNTFEDSTCDFIANGFVCKRLVYCGFE